MVFEPEEKNNNKTLKHTIFYKNKKLKKHEKCTTLTQSYDASAKKFLFEVQWRFQIQSSVFLAAFPREKGDILSRTQPAARHAMEIKKSPVPLLFLLRYHQFSKIVTSRGYVETVTR